MVSFQVNCINLKQPSPAVYSLLTISDTGRLRMMSEQMEIIAALVASYFPSIVGQWLDVGCESPLDKQQERRNEEDLRVYTDRVSGGRTRRSVWLRERRMVCRKRRQILDRRSPHSITSYQPHITHLIYLPLLLSPLPLLLSFLPHPSPCHAFLPALHLLVSSGSSRPRLRGRVESSGCVRSIMFGPWQQAWNTGFRCSWQCSFECLKSAGFLLKH